MATFHLCLYMENSKQCTVHLTMAPVVHLTMVPVVWLGLGYKNTIILKIDNMSFLEFVQVQEKHIVVYRGDGFPEKRL